VNRQVQSAERSYTAEELQLIVQESEELGVLRAEAGRMLQELFEFGDLTAGEVMVPRVGITGIAVGTEPATLRALLAGKPHTRYPIFEKDLDHIVGMVHIKDLLRVLLLDETIAPRHARAIPVVPETAALDAVLDTMRREGTQMAVVIDEHGGTAGVVTLQDLFEEVIGDLEERMGGDLRIRRDAEGRLRVPGTLRVDELGQQFHIDLEHEDVDSVSGLVLTLLGRPPIVGDSVTYDRLQIEVTAVRGRGVAEVAVTLREPDEPGGADGA
jgi:CBS domain containing-hemolysin-like protein